MSRAIEPLSYATPADVARDAMARSDSPLRAGVHLVLAVVVLAGGAAGLQIAKARGSLQLIKKPLPIRKPLTDFDTAVFKPWSATGARMRPDTAEELGTNEYAMWGLTDGGKANVLATVFLSYYTGVQDQMPHVPEECYTVGAYSLDNKSEMSDVMLAGSPATVCRLMFSPPAVDLAAGDSSRIFVYYVISVNGALFAARDPARFKMADPRDRHLYYSKVEISFRVQGDVDEKWLDSAATSLLDRTVTELYRTHWPLRGAERGGARRPNEVRAAAQIEKEAESWQGLSTSLSSVFWRW